MPSTPPRALAASLLGLSVLLCTAITTAGPDVATAAPAYPSDAMRPDVITPLTGYDRLWQPTGAGTLRGTVLDGATLARNDELASWVNQHATPAQQFKAMQDSEIIETNGGYDQSYTVADALGSVLGPLYVKGRHDGALPLTSALVNSTNGSAGMYVDTTASKPRFAYPRPYLPGSATAAGDPPQCPGSVYNASSLDANRAGKPYADSTGSLKITRVADVVDKTHQYSPNDVDLSVGYNGAGLCSGGSYPSGHTVSAYNADIALATLLPELGPELLARASEGGNNRIVLGVHYPLDTIGGRMVGQIGLAARWSDASFRTDVLQPARAELVSYLEKGCGGTLAQCIARQTPYQSNPYGGQVVPGGTSQVVTDRASALAVYRERSSYGFAPTGATGQAPSVPATAQALLISTFPTLTDAQRTSVLAQTQLPSGHPLDLTGTAGGSWQRIELADAMSATVQRNADGTVTVTAIGGAPRVVLPALGSVRAKLVGVAKARSGAAKTVKLRVRAGIGQDGSRVVTTARLRGAGKHPVVARRTTSAAAGTATVTIKLKHRALRQLRSTGRLKLLVTVSVTAPSGTPVTRTTRVRTRGTAR